MKRPTNIFLKIVLVTIINLPFIVTAASPGSLDPTFGAFGKVITNFQNGERSFGIATQPDGKIVIAGTINTGGTDDFFVLRYNANGSLDPTFDTDGKVSTDFSGGHDRAFGVSIQSDGKIVVVGYTIITGFSDTIIARYLPNGSLDNSFDSDGRVLLTIGGVGNVGDGLNCVALQPDGKIVAGGYVSGDFAILRLNLDGSFDTSFNTNGYTITSVSVGGDAIKSIVILPDGKIVSGGNDTGNLAMTRYNATGVLDTTFGTAGIVKTSFGGSTQGTALALQSDGKLVAAGYVSNSQYNFAVARYNSDGNLDTTFDTDGKVVTNVNPNGADFATDVVVQSDGKIIVSGFEGSAGSWHFGLVRYEANGALDTGFGNNGIIKTDFGTDAVASACALYGDKLIVIGDGFEGVSIKLARYNLSVTPSASADFDGDGFADYAVFRPATGVWYVLRSGDSSVQIRQFGINGDIPLDGDFDGDQKSDLAVFRPTAGQWWIDKSASGQSFAVSFGQNGDKPVVDDYDKDGKTDVAFWRPADGNWYVLRSGSNFSTYYALPFGQNGDIPIQSAETP